MKPADRQLMQDVRDRYVSKRDGYDWNDRTGRDVTVHIRRLELAGMVSYKACDRPGRALLGRWRWTRAAHAVMAATAMEVNDAAA